MSRLPEPPRVRLARLPTPIEPLGDLDRELGVRVFVKRDDLTGNVLSGNKVRKLELVLARALERRADVLLTCGGVQSNHCRCTAAVARRAGLDVELFLRDAAGAPVEGNYFLDLLFDARIHPLTAEQYRDRDRLMAERAEELEAAGRSAFVIPEGASDALGSFAYARCMEEILDHTAVSGDAFDLIVAAVGSGGTLAGLLAGAEVLGFEGRIVGVPVCDDAAHFRGVVDGILEAMGRELLPGLAARVAPDGLLDGQVGLGYGQASARELERIRDVAAMTGLVLDPTYTNKAFGGLLELIRSGRAPAGSRVLFLHTGGLFGLLPFARRVAPPVA